MGRLAPFPRHAPEILGPLPDTVCIVDADGRYLYINATFERTLRYCPQEMIGRFRIRLI